MKSKKETEKIHWLSVPRKARVKYDSGSYYYDGALVVWHSHEAEIAQKSLKVRCK